LPCKTTWPLWRAILSVLILYAALAGKPLADGKLQGRAECGNCLWAEMQHLLSTAGCCCAARSCSISIKLRTPDNCELQSKRHLEPLTHYSLIRRASNRKTSVAPGRERERRPSYSLPFVGRERNTEPSGSPRR